jgi:hypothetical protein
MQAVRFSAHIDDDINRGQTGRHRNDQCYIDKMIGDRYPNNAERALNKATTLG